MFAGWYLIQQATGGGNIDLGPAIQQIGIGALIAVPAYTMCWILWNSLKEARKRDEASTLARLADKDALVARERELADGAIPMLAAAAKVLADTPDKFDRVLEKAGSERRSEMDMWIRRLENIMDEVTRPNRGRSLE